MARILAYTSPARGHLYPIVPTLLELRNRGHAVVVRTARADIDLVRALGFEAAPLDAAVESIEQSDWQGGAKPLTSLRLAVRTFCTRARLEAPDFIRAIEETDAEAAFIDVNAWGAVSAVQRTRKPWAMYTPYSMYLPSPEVPPFGFGFAPRHDPIGWVRDRIGYAALRPIERLMLDGMNGVRRELGLRAFGDWMDYASTPPVIIAYTAEPFEYHRGDWPQNYRLVGPGIWDPPTPPPAWLNHITRPIVLVTCSTEYQNDATLITTTLEALRDENIFVVATTAAVDPSGFNVPSNARVERFLPHRAILESSVCVVCHAGMGITQKALASGVPVCAVPFGRDQFEVARRVDVARAGTCLPAKRLNAARLRSSVRMAMTRNDGALRIARAFEAKGGPAAAADAFETVLR